MQGSILELNYRGMYQEIRSLYQLDTRKMLWFIGFTFAVIYIFQYLELPSRFSINNFLASGNSTGSDPNMFGSFTRVKSQNQTSIDLVDDLSQSNNSFSVPSPAPVPAPIIPVYADKKPSVPPSLSTKSSLNVSSPAKERVHNFNNIKKPGVQVQLSNLTKPVDHSSADVKKIPEKRVEAKKVLEKPVEVKKIPEKPKSEVISLAEMGDLLRESRAKHHSVKPRWSSAVDKELQYAKSQIENAPYVKDDQILYSPLYRNLSMFKRSYELMEEMLKVYVYKEGKRPILHVPVLKGIYASEGWFMKLMESNQKFVTKDAAKAHLFYLPFSSRMLGEKLYVKDSHSYKDLIQFLKEYLDLISSRYSFWNRTQGVDHFLVACHDWAPAETRKIMANCIRALCNSDVKEGFVFGRDVALPETKVRTPKKPLNGLGGKSASERTTLAFFAGSMHGYLRPIILQHWGGNKDPDMKVFGRLPRSRSKSKRSDSYVEYMKSSKYCICPKGYEVNSPRVVEAIFYECVPVIISDNFVPPFVEMLNWEAFAVFVLEKDVPNLKNILLSIKDRRYKVMQTSVKRVQQHFLWHAKPVKYDIFHMILHTVWYNRVFQI